MSLPLMSWILSMIRSKSSELLREEEVNVLFAVVLFAVNRAYCFASVLQIKYYTIETISRRKVISL